MYSQEKAGGNFMSEIAIYQSIALDIAQKIANGEFPVNTKISGRTLLASHYHVSSETIRKAISLLKDEHIVQVSQGKEITVLSKQKAAEYYNKYKYLKSVYSLKQELVMLLKVKKENDRKFDEILNDIINFSDRLRNLTPYNPIEVEIMESSHIVGKTIDNLQFWQMTGATIVALRRGNQITISPGPSVILRENDIIVFVGDNQAHERTLAFINKTI
jgi:K+/H+ antiporter YhaU regulatory subunit KhtT